MWNSSEWSPSLLLCSNIWYQQQEKKSNGIRKMLTLHYFTIAFSVTCLFCCFTNCNSSIVSSLELVQLSAIVFHSVLLFFSTPIAPKCVHSNNENQWKDKYMAFSMSFSCYKNAVDIFREKFFFCRYCIG